MFRFTNFWQFEAVEMVPGRAELPAMVGGTV
jgi:hypothetical protein